MFKKCDSTLFKKTNYEVSLLDSNKGIFHIAINSCSVLFEDDMKKRDKVHGFNVQKNKGEKRYETIIEIQVIPKEGSLSDISNELQFTLSKASEYNILYSRDRDAINKKFDQFLRENKIETQAKPQAELGTYYSGGNAY